MSARRLGSFSAHQADAASSAGASFLRGLALSGLFKWNDHLLRGLYELVRCNRSAIGVRSKVERHEPLDVITAGSANRDRILARDSQG
eukprot:scaffold31817_cov83-Phaeocystis_antarctica.AAC.3